jgi:putative SOS response-associated peptidase YedK
VGEGEVFAFAGLWDRWLDPNGTILESCTILTTTPNQLLSNFHDRMPVILSPENYAAWLAPGNTDVALEMLKPYERTMRSYPVSTRLNQALNTDPSSSGTFTSPGPVENFLGFVHLACLMRSSNTSAMQNANLNGSRVIRPL